ncbi:hypothetical protein JCM10212_006303, partial [Sporobolomyces blumeae]
LIALHFPPSSSPSTRPGVPPKSPPPTSPSSSSPLSNGSGPTSNPDVPTPISFSSLSSTLGKVWKSPPPPTMAANPSSTFGALDRDGARGGGLRAAKDLWRSTVGNVDVQLEREEQKIVKWQEDKEVTKCSICSAPFGLTTRRHHCRLCGRVICFLPPNASASTLPSPPSISPREGGPDARGGKDEDKGGAVVRRERCSTFFTFVGQDEEGDRRDAQGEKRIGRGGRGTQATGGASTRRNGLVVEVRPVEQDLSLEATFQIGTNGDKGMQTKQVEVKDKERDQKKVRVCRECLATVLCVTSSFRPALCVKQPLTLDDSIPVTPNYRLDHRS